MTQPAVRLSIELVAEIARLQSDLDKAKREVRKASSDISTSARAANDNLARMGSSLGGVSSISRAMRANMTNLSRQFVDVAQGVALNQAPMQILVQQGFQISEALASISYEARRSESSMTGLALRGLGKATPAILAAAAVGGTLSGVLATVTNDVNKTSSVTVTWGDIALGTFDAIVESAQNNVAAAFKNLGVDVVEVWETISSTARTSANLVIGSFEAARKSILAAFLTFPPALAEIFIDASNQALAAIERLVNGAIAGVNNFSALANDAFGTSFGVISEIELGQIENSYRGAGLAAGRALQSAVSEVNRDFLGDFAEFVSPFAQERARIRLEKEAEKAGKTAGRKAGKASAKATVDSFEDAFADLAFASEQIGVLDDLNAVVRDRLTSSERELRLAGLNGAAREEMLDQLEQEEQLRSLAELRNQARFQQAEDRRNGIEDETGRYERLLQALRDIENAEGATRTLNNQARETERLREETQLLNDGLADTVALLDRVGGLGSTFAGILGVATGQTSAIRGPFGDLLGITVGTQQDPSNKDRLIPVTLGDELTAALEDKLGKRLDNIATVIQGAGLGVAGGNLIFGSQSGLGQAGSALGGIAGNAFGSSVLGFLGSAAGPVGSIVGGILGGGLGSILSGPDKGSATINGGSVTGFSGRSSNRDTASGLADSVLAGINEIAEALGAELNAAAGSVSIGVRNGEFRVDTLGRGNTRGSGVVNTGTDANAAIALAINDLVADDVLSGLSPQIEQLLTGPGGLEDNLAKALTFQGALDALRASTNPLIAELAALEAEMNDLDRLFGEAGATAEQYADLQALQIRRTQEILDAAAQSYRSTFFTDAENLAAAQGQISSTLTPLGLSDVDTVAEYRALVEAQDLTTAAGRELYGTLLDLVDAFSVVRDAERRATDEAAQRAAQAEAERVAAIAEAEAEAEAEAQRLAAIADQRRSMEIELLELQGRSVEAVALSRNAELKALDETLRPLQRQIFLAQDIADAREDLNS
ncbi:MAG: phage tail length tape measure family protein, partial [Pseudomonadota bacterium]